MILELVREKKCKCKVPKYGQEGPKMAPFFVPLKKIQKNPVFSTEFIEEKCFGSILYMKKCVKGF
jgi:hypothetical protein